ncbi:MAG: thioredoxin domain-containing protein [Thermodesulfobacteriota bacterium]
MPNRLIHEQSPYLLQHAHNPVDWYPWGEEAFEKARVEDKPVFLSIGYATCHWCHVMAHESFEDEEVALKLNQSYIAIKVDREERPDVDQVYMSVCQALTGRGGWPLSVFLTPEKKPFFAGTYFPKTSRMGLSGFMELLTQIAALWQRDRGRILQAATQTTQAIQPHYFSAGENNALGEETLVLARSQLHQSFDPRYGGFGKAPKFPTPHHLTFLLRSYRRSGDLESRTIIEKTLQAMRFGGLFDQIGGGFHRYSVDEKWQVPHFEKMLYDQALLAMAFGEAFQRLKNPFYARVCREIFSYVLRDLTAPEGGFYSAEDADSEGREGLFYLWNYKEIHELLGRESGDLFCRFYHITPDGNFEEGKNIPFQSLSLEKFALTENMGVVELERRLEEARERLFFVRQGRIHPLKDDKILTAWNGLMIAALSKGTQSLGDQKYAQAAEKAARFLLEKMNSREGGLYRRYRQGHVAHPGFLEDYAFLIWGLIELYETVFNVYFLEQAIALNDRLVDLFWDEKEGGCYYTPRNGEELILREKDLYDGALPSGNSVTALNFLRLARITGRTDLEEKAEQILRFSATRVAAQPMAYTQLLCALDFMVGPSKAIVVAGDISDSGTRQMVELIQEPFIPNKVILLKPPLEKEGQEISKLAPFLESIKMINNRPAVYVCSQNTCQTPATELGELEKALKEGELE